MEQRREFEELLASRQLAGNACACSTAACACSTADAPGCAAATAGPATTADARVWIAVFGGAQKPAALSWARRAAAAQPHLLCTVLSVGAARSKLTESSSSGVWPDALDVGAASSVLLSDDGRRTPAELLIDHGALFAPQQTALPMQQASGGGGGSSSGRRTGRIKCSEAYTAAAVKLSSDEDDASADGDTTDGAARPLFAESSRRPPAPQEVELRVVFWALGDGARSAECSGVVTAVGQYRPDLGFLSKVGDTVVALAGGGPRELGSYVTVHAALVLPRPLHLAPRDACGHVRAAAAARLALLHHGRLRRGEWVLVHDASTAVGLAAVRLALTEMGCVVLAQLRGGAGGVAAEEATRLLNMGARAVLRSEGNILEAYYAALCHVSCAPSAVPFSG